ncbi:MAG: hypothetical protein R3B09_28215 [Nannocystaceae bacterium]
MPPAAVIAFLAVTTALWLRLTLGPRRTLRIPWGALLLVLAAIVTVIQCAPLPEGLRAALAPGIVDRIAAALAGVDVIAWPSLSPRPADTALEAARIFGLCALVIAAAQRPWRTAAGLVSAAGGLCAGVGLVQAGLGIPRILGVYAPIDADPTQSAALLTTFVNANHQSDLFLLAIFASAALLVPSSRGDGDDEPRPERAAILWAALLLSGVALILSLSRGALIACGVMAVPALGFAWIPGPVERGPRRGRWRGRALRLLVIAGVAALVARASGALRELASLDAPGAGAGDKLRLAVDALPLHDLAPALGVGRGAFVDLFPAVDSAPSTVIYTHLESAPATLWIEWGGFGAVLALGLVLAFVAALWGAGRRPGAPARRVALCGIAAVAIHNLGDFSLEFLGVAAPLCALAGALAGGGRSLPARPLAAIGGPLLAAATATAILVAPRTWWFAEDEARAIAEGAPGAEAALRVRPLDARLHRAIAWRALEDGDVATARRHATTATALRPGESDTWLLRAAAERASGDEAAASASIARALDALQGPPSEALARYLLGLHADPRALGPEMPRSPTRWAAIVSGLVLVDPEAALAVATTRVAGGDDDAEDDEDPAPILEVQCAAAMHADNAALAIHYCRLLVAAAPARAGARLLLIKALERSLHARSDEIEATLIEALESGAIVDPAELGLLEEELVRRWVERGDPGSLARARERMPQLLGRPADRPTLQRRHALGRAAATGPADADK